MRDYLFGQNGRGKRFALTPIVDTGLPDRNLSHSGDQFPRLVGAIPDHLPVTLVIFLVLKAFDIGLHFKLQGGLQHPSGASAKQLFQAEGHFIFDYLFYFGGCILCHGAYPFSLG